MVSLSIVEETNDRNGSFEETAYSEPYGIVQTLEHFPRGF